MSEKFRLDRNFGFRNTFNTKCINVIIDSIGPSIILRSICPLSNFIILIKYWLYSTLKVHCALRANYD